MNIILTQFVLYGIPIAIITGLCIGFIYSILVDFISNLDWHMECVGNSVMPILQKFIDAIQRVVP